MMNRLFIKEGVFAAALFANDELTLDAFNEQHLIFQLPIKGLWKPKPVLFQADSFLFVKDEELFLFYELQHWDNPGYIVMTKTSDLKTWTMPIIVLQEPFHLSFPYVFEDNGTIYMVPESQESDSIRLYRANDDLTSFTFVRTLLKKEREEGLHYNLNDSHIYKQEGKYYLFTSYQEDWMYYQELYVTEDLLNGSFVRHPQSPICTSNEYGRNGGSLIQYGNKLLRVTQDCHQNYGDNISLMEVIQLDEQHYQEQLFMRNVFPKNSIFIDGGHQLNIVQYKGQYIYATDYKVNKWAWYKPYIGMLVKLKLHQKRG